MLDFYDARALVWDALIEFYPNYCEFICEEDVDHFLDKHKNVYRVSSQPGLLSFTCEQDKRDEADIHS